MSCRSCNQAFEPEDIILVCSLCKCNIECEHCRTQDRFCAPCWDRALLQQNPRPNFQPDAPIEIEVAHIQSYAQKRKNLQLSLQKSKFVKQETTVPRVLADHTTLIDLAHMPWPELKPSMLATLHPHELDKTVLLDETFNRHDYYVNYENDGKMEKENNVSTTTLLHIYFPSKDTFKLLKNTLMGKNWGHKPTCKYAPFYSEDECQIPKNLVKIIKLWGKNKIDGAQLGKFVHFLIECDLNNILDLASSPYARYQHVKQYLWWKHTHFLPRYNAYRTEFRIRSCKKYRKVGTADFLAVRKDHPPPSETNGILWIADFDWKCIRLQTFNFDNEKGIDLCNFMDNCNFSEYTFQQNDYGRFFEQDMYRDFVYNGYVYNKIRFESMDLVVLSDENPKPEEAKVAPVSKEPELIEQVWQRRAEEIAIWEAEGRPVIPKPVHPQLSDQEMEDKCREVMYEVEVLMQRGKQSLFKPKNN